MRELYIGYDIGGTKCAVILGSAAAEILEQRRFATESARGWKAVVDQLLEETQAILNQRGLEGKDIRSAGISCGGPLDSKAGVILSPPNLPDWDRVPLTQLIEQRFGFPCRLQNDANACALAEWKFGAGKGLSNLIFLTFGTGMGAGLILDGRLYAGTNDMAGEVGHMRLAEDGPEGYGKRGSFEGFCSGGGIARLAQSLAKQALEQGDPPAFCKAPEQLSAVSAHSVAIAAQQGDPLAQEVYRICGTQLGRGLALLMDVLNPQAIIIGSIYARSGALLEEQLQKTLREEALPHTRSVCRILPAALGDDIGNYAALGVAMNEL